MSIEVEIDKKDELKSKKVDEKLASLEDNIVEKEHTFLIGNEEVKCTSYTGTRVLYHEKDADTPVPKAEIFFVAYIKQDEVPDERPITFAFNGGPGSSSVWLHIGMLGPKRVKVERDEKQLQPPFRLSDNESSILDMSDLVFIDPVGTGYSRPAPGTKAKEFHTYEKDIESVAEFIRSFVTEHERWASAKYLIGESYGTTRGAGLSGYLLDKFGMRLSGLILVSVILNFQTSYFKIGNDLPFIVFLPTYTATAWYHKKLQNGLSLSEAIAKCKAFVETEYINALHKGDTLPDAEYQALQRKLAELTGLSEQYIDNSRLRIHDDKFVKELLRTEKRTIGRLDSRFTGRDRDSTGSKNEFDPSYSVIYAPYTETYNDFLARTLGFKREISYHILAPLYKNWKYDKNQNEYLNVSETLRKTMVQSPDMKIFIATGYFDLATPFYATEYTLNHMMLPEELKRNVTISEYPGGHMMYTKEENLSRLKSDLRKFYQSENK